MLVEAKNAGALDAVVADHLLIKDAGLSVTICAIHSRRYCAIISDTDRALRDWRVSMRHQWRAKAQKDQLAKAA